MSNLWGMHGRIIIVPNKYHGMCHSREMHKCLCFVIAKGTFLKVFKAAAFFQTDMGTLEGIPVIFAHMCTHSHMQGGGDRRSDASEGFVLIQHIVILG